MKRFLVLAVALITGCGGLFQDDADEFRNASPSRQGIKIEVPSKGQALEASDVGSTQQSLLGERASCYTLTRGVTVVVNGGVAWVLGLCEQIIQYPATTTSDTQAVWGPWTDSLSPNTYRFTVTKVAKGYDYVLEAKDKSLDDSAYLTLISGHHEPGTAKLEGAGSFKVDWDAGQKLPEHGKELGSAEVGYARNDKLDVTVDVAFKQVEDAETGARIDASYAFAKKNGGDGAFEFVVFKDMVGLPNDTAALEREAVKSRWQDNGAGRCDISFSGGDLTTEVTASECWGESFLETYYQDSLGITATQGEEKSCVFANAEYTKL